MLRRKAMSHKSNDTKLLLSRRVNFIDDVCDQVVPIGIFSEPIMWIILWNPHLRTYYRLNITTHILCRSKIAFNHSMTSGLHT